MNKFCVDFLIEVSVLETSTEGLKNKEEIIKKQNTEMKQKLEIELNLKQQIQDLQKAHDARDDEAKELEKCGVVCKKSIKLSLFTVFIVEDWGCQN